jgi:hypothetical protein
MSNPQRVAKDEPERIVLNNINEFGWHAVNVIEDDDYPPWSFTIGLYETWQHPELIVIGRSRATAHKMLECLATQIENGSAPDFADHDPYPLLGIPCHFIEVNPRYYSDYVGFALWFYRKRRFPLYQIIWPGNDGLFPWHPRAPSTFREWQPLLGNSPCAMGEPHACER